MKVKDLMTTDVVTIGSEGSLKDVAKILAERRISGVPVVDAERRVLGVVSEADILYKAKGPDEKAGGFLGWLLLEGVEADAKLTARTAGEAMTTPVISVGPERAVAEAAAKMVEYGVNRLPVVDDEGKLVGLVSRADIVRAFTRTDAEIMREIREDVILKTLWISPERVNVTVAKGEVTLSGQVETKNDAELLPHFVERVPGVVSVTSNMSWEYEERKLPKSEPRVPVPPYR